MNIDSLNSRAPGGIWPRHASPPPENSPAPEPSPPSQALLEPSPPAPAAGAAEAPVLLIEETIGLDHGLIEGIKVKAFPLNSLLKAKRKLLGRLEDAETDVRASIDHLAETLKGAHVDRVEIKGYALGIKELGGAVAQTARGILARKLDIDPDRVHGSGSGGSDPAIGLKVFVHGAAAAAHDGAQSPPVPPPSYA